MILKNLNYNDSKTSKWIKPLFLYHNKEIGKLLKHLPIIGSALGDVKHGIKNDLLIVVNSKDKSKYLDIYTKILNLDKTSYTYSYFNESDIVQVLGFKLDKIPKDALDCVLESRYSHLFEIYGSKINAIYDFNNISIIRKNPNTIKNFIIAQSSKLNVAEEDIKVTEAETEFIIEKELLWNQEDIEDINLRNLIENNKGNLLNDLKIALADTSLSNKTIYVHNTNISRELLENIIKYLEPSK